MDIKKFIFAQLKKANPGAPEKLLRTLSAKIAKDVTTEEEATNAIEEFESNSVISISDMAAIMQAEGDRRAALVSRKNPTLSNDDEENEDEDSKGNQSTKGKGQKSEITELKELVSTLTSTVQSLVSEKNTSSIKSKMEAKLSEKNIPLVLLKNRVPEKEEDMESILEEIESDFKEIGGVLKPAGKVGSLKPPVSSHLANQGIDNDTPDPAIEAYIKSKQASQQQN